MSADTDESVRDEDGRGCAIGIDFENAGIVTEAGTADERFVRVFVLLELAVTESFVEFVFINEHSFGATGSRVEVDAPRHGEVTTAEAVDFVAKSLDSEVGDIPGAVGKGRSGPALATPDFTSS